MPVAVEKKQFDPAPAGTHFARCFGCISLGTQTSDLYPTAFKVMLMFELPMEVIDHPEGPMPMTVSKEYTLSLGKKANLRKHLDTWRGRPFAEAELEGFEVSKVVGAPCLLTIVHKTSAKGSTYASIESISGIPKGQACPPQIHTSIKYEITDGNENTSETYRRLPDWIRDKIRACEEWKPSTIAPQAIAPPPTPAPAPAAAPQAIAPPAGGAPVLAAAQPAPAPAVATLDTADDDIPF